MTASLKYVLDRLFLFTLALSIVIFSLDYIIGLSKVAVSTIEYIDFVILLGYYYLFGLGLFRANKRMLYLKSHWVMGLFLLLPFIPLLRTLGQAKVQQAMQVGTNSLWHLLDELKML